MTSRRRWTAEDYATIEALVPFRLSATQIGQFLDPPASGPQVADACRAAGIALGRTSGRPSTEQQAEWDRMRREHLRAVAADAERRRQITEYAASLGYTVQLRRVWPGETS